MPLIYLCLLFFQALFSLDRTIKEEIKHLVAGNPYQLSVNEYSLIAEHLVQKAPCNMLVFGVGRDSSLWIKSNRFGKTVFLEDSPVWLQKVREQIPTIDAYLVTYGTKLSDWRVWLESENLLLDLPEELMDTKWDIIFVDGPEGWSDEKPGRMKSIFTAALLAFKSGDCRVFVHDCDRPVESAFASKFLRDENLQATLDRMNVYSIP